MKKYLVISIVIIVIGIFVLTTHVEEYYNIQEYNGGLSSEYYKWVRNDIIDVVMNSKRHKYILHQNDSGAIIHRDIVDRLIQIKSTLIKTPSDKWQLLPTLRNGKLHSCDLNIWCDKMQPDGHATYWYVLNSKYEVDYLTTP